MHAGSIEGLKWNNTITSDASTSYLVSCSSDCTVNIYNIDKLVPPSPKPNASNEKDEKEEKDKNEESNSKSTHMTVSVEIL